MIPKIIYYAWFGKQELPVEVKNNIANWKKINPDFEIVEINETNFPIDDYNFAKVAYSTNNWAFVSDVARLWAVANTGGFYLDTDVELLKPLAPFVKEQSVWALENANAIATGLFFGAEQENSDVINILNLYRDIIFNPEQPGTTTTVSIVTNYFKLKGFQLRNRQQTLASGAKIFPVEYFAPLHYWGGGRVTRKTVAIHRYSATWLQNSGGLKIGKFDQRRIRLQTSLYFPKSYDWLERTFRKWKRK
ncbi:glycosyl transferase [Weissella confusa]|uniref:glycosyltransferase family 32 protein n=1 Tax=Weissella TaxID=46255 RepID=UPI0018F21B94|nr:MULTISPECIES: glycosyltransferase [Weissella]MBJ7620276.1 glycosyl transferase [Weissella confusa]MBJ7667817.1 glycosyl transferase [Weissella confusa]MBJ7683084.1 glycosyl transferase [Weissella confusa]MBJ7685271.1 glycosyl transferase [Weissella confusa]MBJ7702561.1 glycosyl transferase [Weissella confusa]